MASFLLAFCVFSACTIALADYDIRVVFFNQPDLDGTSATYKDTIKDGRCTDCRDFGGKGNSWVSYAVGAPPQANTSLTIYDGDKCNGRSVTSYATYGNFSDTLGNNIDSWKACPAGTNP